MAEEGVVEGGKGAVTKKLGPLPVYGWAGLAVGAWLLYKHFSGSSSATASPNASIAAPDPLNTAGSNATTTLSGQLTNLQGTDSSILGLLNQFAQSPSIPSVQTSPSTTGPTFSADVQHIYTDLLGRPVGSTDLAGESFWQSKGLDQLHTLTAVEATPEAQALAAANPVAYVTGQYKYTGQAADQGGVNYWSSYVTQHGAVQEANAFANATAANRGQKPVV